MSEGVVLEIFITPESGGDMNSVESVSAIEGRGLMGDRYYSLAGTFSEAAIEPDQEISLIEAEAFEELSKVHGVELEYSESRRNLVTRNCDLNSLVGKTFQVGAVTLTGIRLCEPCAYLSSKTGNSNLVKQWLHRAGLRARIVRSGQISVGDNITV